MRLVHGSTVAIGVAAVSCLNPTEIILELSTNVACVGDHGVAVAVGAPNDDDSGVSAVGKSCTSDGGLGTVVILPHSGIDQLVGIRVTLGIDAAADQCRAPYFEGCIVARRSLRFDPHTPLTLPVELDQSCVGVPCTPYSTCVAGTCVDAGVTCDGGNCTIESDGGPPPGACVATQGAILIQPNIAATGTSRIVRTRSGWAVLYQSSGAGQLSADVIVEADGLLAIGQPVQLTSTSSSIGAFGTTNNAFALTYGKGTDTAGAFVGFDGGSVTWAQPTAVPGVRGLFQMDDAGTIVTTAINNATSQQQPVFLDVVSGGAPALFSAFTVPSGASNIGLAQNVSIPTELFATFNDNASACNAYVCNWVANVLSCGNIDTVQSCDRIRGAARGTSHAFVTISHGSNIVIADAIYTVGTVDGFDGLAIVATKSDYPILTVVSGALLAARYDGVTQPTSSPLATGINVLTPITSIDAVADDPTSSGYAVSIVSGTNLYFMHVCN